MRGVDIVHRGAYFTIVLCLIRNKQILFKTQTKSHGWISEEPKGENGFGYDPIFVGQNTFGKTYAELDRARKDSRSHRQLALREFRLWLSNQFKEKE
jgi:XTP/dITP diphosphohydrolase